MWRSWFWGTVIGLIGIGAWLALDTLLGDAPFLWQAVVGLGGCAIGGIAVIWLWNTRD